MSNKAQEKQGMATPVCKSVLSNFQGILNDGTVVAIKRAHTSTCENPYDQCRIVSKLQHKNIVKCLGYGHEVKFSSRKWMWNRKNDQEKETEFFLVEEYMPNGSLDMLIDGKFPLEYHSILLPNFSLN